MPEAPALNRAASTAALTQLRRAACSRTLQRRWRAWAAAQRTTSALAAAFSACGVSLRAGRRADFDAFAAALQAGATLRAARALLTRLDARLQARGVPQGDSERNALRRLFPPRAQPAAGAAGAPRRAAVAAAPPTTPSAAAGPSTPAGRPRGPGGLAPAPAPADRFPARVLLCAWVIRLFPEVVLQRRSSERETALAAAAAALVDATEALVARLAPRDDVAGGGSSSDSEEQQPLNPKSIDNPGDAEPAPDVSLGSLLVCFDAAWVRYLDQFVAWKRADADALLTDLTACAAAMHTSLARKCGTAAAAAATREAPSSGTGGAPSADDVLDLAQLAGGSPDRQALLAQVRADVALLRERCAALAGAAGAERLRAALAAAAEAAAAEEAREADAAAEGNERIMHELMHDGARGDGARRGAGSGSSGGSDDEDNDNEQGGRESGGWQEAEQPQPTSPRGMARRVRAALKAAFWESFSAAAAADASSAAGTTPADAAAPPVYVGVMAEMRDELASLSPAAATAALSPRLDTATSAFREALLRGDTAGAGAALREYVAAAAGALRQLGAPAREDAFDAALRRLDASAQRVALPAAAAAAMRLLFAQLARLRRDVAAAARNALAPAARGAAGAAWAAARFARRHRLPPPGAGGGAATLPAAALPRTRALMAAAARALPAADAELGAAMAAQPAPLLPAASPASPAVMLTGRLRSNPATPASPAESSGGGASPGAMPPPQGGVAALRSAPALLRLGLIALLQSPPAGGAADAAGLQLPETLAFDGARLDAAAEAFQRAVLLAAAFALLPQLRGAAANASPSAPAPPASDELRERLCALLGDASTRLADVASEVARAAGAPGDADAAERGLARLTARGEAPRAALEASLASALRAHLLLGAHRGGTAAATAALRRCGAEAAAALGDEVARLAARLERVAAVSLRVHAPLYAALAAAHLAA